MSHAKQLYDRRKSNGVCVRCGERPPREDRVQCSKCSEKQLKYYAERRKKFIESGICPSCKEIKPQDGYILCEDCKENNRTSLMHRYYARRESGICVRCGTTSATANKLHCDRCLEQMRNLAGSRLPYRIVVVNRDDNACQVCGRTIGLVVHHIDGTGEHKDNTNNDLTNLITLCRPCHASLHRFRAEYCNQQLIVNLILA